MTKDEMRAAIERLRAVSFDGTNSHDRLARICNALYQPEHGWTKGACEGLRAVLVDLLEQVAVADSAYGDGIRDGMEQTLKGLADDDLVKYGLVRLPKDADGEYIHIGDVMEWNDGECFEAVGIGDNAVFFDDSDESGAYEFSTPETLRHHKPTVEDVLAKMLDTWDGLPFNASNEAIIAEYAAKLTLKEESDE